MKVRILGIAITAAILVVGFTFWRSTTNPNVGKSANFAAAQHRGGQIVTSGRAAPRTFNRLLGQDQLSFVLGVVTQGHLVRVNYETFEVEPWLAERWDTSPDGLTYTFHIRQGVHYAPPLQNVTVQAQDFIRALLREVAGCDSRRTLSRRALQRAYGRIRAGTGRSEDRSADTARCGDSRGAARSLAPVR